MEAVLVKAFRECGLLSGLIAAACVENFLSSRFASNEGTLSILPYQYEKAPDKMPGASHWIKMDHLAGVIFIWPSIIMLTMRASSLITRASSPT